MLDVLEQVTFVSRSSLAVHELVGVREYVMIPDLMQIGLSVFPTQ
jgi:hypothetical protein